jgi:hypothetical protein
MSGVFMKKNVSSYFIFALVLTVFNIPKNSIAETADKIGDVCQTCEQKKGFVKFAEKVVVNLTAQKDGVKFNCTPSEIIELKSGMVKYFTELGLDPKLVEVKDAPDGKGLGFVLNTPAEDTSTLGFGTRKEFNVSDEVVELPTKTGKPRQVTTVSKKEIALALFQHGRLTEFKGPGCKIQAFKDHIGIRQNTAAWTEDLSWGFPDGRASSWNPKYWNDSPMPKRGPLHKAINDIFMNQDRYSMGCYSASKVVMTQGLLDYYARVRPDPAMLAKIEKAMLVDKAPLSDIEPGITWDFVKSMSADDLKQPGKILTVKKGVAPRNFIPGEWVYIKNTDEPSSEKSGYEGSNAVYLGRNNFDDYYGEMKNKHYTFDEKINEVYQWRFGVFTAAESSQKNRKQLSEKEFNDVLDEILKTHRVAADVF